MADYHWGAAYDIGRYEGGYLVEGAPTAHAVQHSGTVTYTLSLYPPDLDHDVDLSVLSTHPDLNLSLTPGTITGSQEAVLTVTDLTSAPGELHTIQVQGTGGGFADTIELVLLVGGDRLYLPGIFR